MLTIEEGLVLLSILLITLFLIHQALKIQAPASYMYQGLDLRSMPKGPETKQLKWIQNNLDGGCTLSRAKTILLGWKQSKAYEFYNNQGEA